MKKLLLLLSLFALPAFGQTNITAPQLTFFNTIGGYFSSFNTNLMTFQHTNNVEVSAGVDWENNVNTTESLTLEYNFSGPWSAESVSRNFGVGGRLVSQQVGVGFSKVLYDTKVTGYIDGGYLFDDKRGLVAIGARAKKALTDNTYLGIGIELPIKAKGTLAPTLSVFTGFRF